MRISVEGHLKKMRAEFKANEQFLIDNPDLPIKTLLEKYKNQVQLEAAINWISNIDSYYNPPLLVK